MAHLQKGCTPEKLPSRLSFESSNLQDRNYSQQFTLQYNANACMELGGLLLFGPPAGVQLVLSRIGPVYAFANLQSLQKLEALSCNFNLASQYLFELPCFQVMTNSN